MKGNNLFIGFLILLIGVFFLLFKLDVIDVDWIAFLKLWPLFLIIIGVGFLPIKGIFKVLLLVLIIVCGYFVYEHQPKNQEITFEYFENDEYEYDEQDSTFNADEEFTQNFNEIYSPGIERATLSIDCAAGKFLLNGTTENLIEANYIGRGISYTFKTEEEAAHSKVTIEPKKARKIIKNESPNTFNIALNQTPIWDFDIEAGAAEIKFDFTPLEVSKIDIDGGASSIEFKIGEQKTTTNIDVEAGAASIKIIIPKSAGCQIKSSIVLGGKDFEGFKKIENGLFRTENFQKSEQIINIDIDAAISKVSIERY